MPTIANKSGDWLDEIAGDQRRYVPFMASGQRAPMNDGVSVVGSQADAIRRIKAAQRSGGGTTRRGGGDSDDLLIVGAIGLALLG